MTPAPKRRWFRFSLRTLLLLVVLIGIPLGWVGNRVNWIRQRRAFLQGPSASPNVSLKPQVDTPGMLWLFGESSHPIIWCRPEDVAEARRLFPEVHYLVHRQNPERDLLLSNPY